MACEDLQVVGKPAQRLSGQRAFQEEQRPGAARSRDVKGPMSLGGPGRRIVDDTRAAEGNEGNKDRKGPDRPLEGLWLLL